MLSSDRPSVTGRRVVICDYNALLLFSPERLLQVVDDLFATAMA